MSYVARIALGTFVLVNSALAAVGQISACPFTISQPGQYHIVKDLTCPVNGIVVSASNVDLFFDGHTLNGVGTGVFGVLVTGSNDSISGGGTVTRFDFGVAIESVSDEAPTSGNRMTNITATNSLNHGILVLNTVNNNIVNCTANNNGLDGFMIGSDNTLTANTANGNGASGIEVFADDNTLRANETDGNHLYGIFVDFGVTGNLIQANRSFNNVPNDLADLNGNCASNIWRANQFGTPNLPSKSCIH